MIVESVLFMDHREEKYVSGSAIMSLGLLRSDSFTNYWLKYILISGDTTPKSFLKLN